MQVPYVFSPGFAARSGEVNANFAALAEAITGLQARVDALDGGGNLPLAGSYTLLGYQSGYRSFGAQANIEGIIYTGTATLGGGESSGSVSVQLRELKNELRLTPGGSSGGFQSLDETLSGSWSSGNGGLALVIPGDDGNPRTLRFARASLRLFIGNHINPADGSSVMLFLIRRV